MVPAMVYLLKTPQREANGTSLAVIVPVAIVGATILGRGHQVDIQVGVILAIGAVGGAVLGARLTRRVSDIGLRRAFGIVAVVGGGVVGAVAGAFLALASPDAVLRLLFGCYLTFTGARMLQAPKTKVTQPTMASQ